MQENNDKLHKRSKSGSNIEDTLERENTHVRSKRSNSIWKSPTTNSGTSPTVGFFDSLKSSIFSKGKSEIQSNSSNPSISSEEKEFHNYKDVSNDSESDSDSEVYSSEIIAMPSEEENLNENQFLDLGEITNETGTRKMSLLDRLFSKNEENNNQLANNQEEGTFNKIWNLISSKPPPIPTVEITTKIKYNTKELDFDLKCTATEFSPSLMKKIDLHEKSKKENEEINKKSSPLSVFSLEISKGQILVEPELTPFANLTKLILKDQGLSTINNLTSLTSLVSLDLRKNKIKVIPQNFNQLVMLKDLNISENQISQIAKPCISGLNKLERFNFSSNLMNNFPDVILNSMIEINCSDNKISSLPKEIRSLTSLLKLNMSNNSLSNSSVMIVKELFTIDSIGYLCSLTSLNLSHNKLSILPNSIQNLENLNELLLRNNKITATTEQMQNLKNLTILDLSYNSLASAKYLGKLKSLIKLDLSHNRLKEIPRGLSKLHKLSKLDISSNLFASLGLHLGNLKNLLSLHVDYNVLENISFLLHLESIEVFSASNNKISFIPSELILTPNLREIDLSKNKIAEIPTNICFLKSMQVLNLENNKITQIPYGLCMIQSLRKLALGGNSIKETHYHFSHLKNLKYLSINKITISKYFFLKNKKIK